MLKLEQISKIYRIGTFGGKELHAVNNCGLLLITTRKMVMVKIHTVNSQDIMH